MRAILGLILTGALLLGTIALLAPAGLVHPMIPVGLVLAGALPAAWGAIGHRSRWLTAGIALQLGGIALVGPFIPSWMAWVGTLGVVLVVGAWTLSQTLTANPQKHGLLFAAAILTALLAATLGWIVAEAAGVLAAGGQDARALIVSWTILALALTWGIARWAGMEVPR